MPKNTGAGILLAMLSTVMAFALVWHIWWLAGASFFSVVLASIIHTFNYDREFYIPVEEVIATENERSELLARSSQA